MVDRGDSGISVVHAVVEESDGDSTQDEDEAGSEVKDKEDEQDSEADSEADEEEVNEEEDAAVIGNCPRCVCCGQSR